MYARLREKVTRSGWTLDRSIQVAVDNYGADDTETVGLAAGDEQTYHVGQGSGVARGGGGTGTMPPPQTFGGEFSN